MILLWFYFSGLSDYKKHILSLETGASLDPLGGVENRGLRPRFSTPPMGPGEC